MGIRGPLPKDRSLKVMSGKLPVTKENVAGGGEANVVVFEPPEPPEHFTDDQLKIWHKTVELVKHLNILEKIDVAVLAAYCTSYCLWRDAQDRLMAIKEHEKYYMITEGATGGLVAHPLITISRQAQADMVAYAKEMGMTPSVRMRMTMPEPPPAANPFANLKKKSNERVGKTGQELRKIGEHKN